MGGAGSGALLDAEGSAPPGSGKPVGKQAARLESTGPIAELMSEPFPVPKTGRLEVWVWLRIEDEKEQPSLSIVIRDARWGEPYFKFAPVGQQQPPIHVGWSQFRVPFDDVPARASTNFSWSSFCKAVVECGSTTCNCSIWVSACRRLRSWAKFGAGRCAAAERRIWPVLERVGFVLAAISLGLRSDRGASGGRRYRSETARAERIHHRRRRIEARRNPIGH